MTLVQSWMDSLTLLKPKNLQLFVMVTIKSIIEAYKLYFKYFWWMVLLMTICVATPYIFNIQEYAFYQSYAFYNVQYKHLLFFIPGLLYILLLLAACFCTRPSILQKDCSYFRTQYTKNILCWLLILCLPVKSVIFYIFPWFIFLILFLADSEGGLKSFLHSVWNTLKMMIFNFPLLVITGVVVYYLPIRIFEFIFQSIGQRFSYGMLRDLENLIAALLLPISVCIYANIYIKKLHDQFDLYVNKAQ